MGAIGSVAEPSQTVVVVAALSLGSETVVRLEQVKMTMAKSKKETTRKPSSHTY